MRVLQRRVLPAATALLDRTGVIGRLLRPYAGRAVVLIYHRVLDDPAADPGLPLGVRTDRFEAQMRFLRERMNPVPLDTLVRCLRERTPLPERAVAVTLDDGYADNVSTALPILRRHEIPFTIYLCTGFLDSGRALWWDRLTAICLAASASNLLPGALERAGIPGAGRDVAERKGRESRLDAASAISERLKSLDPSAIDAALDRLARELGVREDPDSLPRPMSWHQARDLVESGAEVGAHTVRHPNLSLLAPDEIRRELGDSKALIESRTGARVSHFAYPFGHRRHTHPGLVPIARQLGYQSVALAVAGTIGAETDRYDLPRLAAPDESASFLAWKMARRMARAERRPSE